MIALKSTLLFASVVSAHSAVWNVTFDGTTYPARDARFDGAFRAKRIEWNFDNAQNFTWAAVTNVSDPGIACGINARPPEIQAKARAGATVTVQWSGIIKGHMGPYMSYLGAWDRQNPISVNDVEYFKIDEAGYDKEKKMWANEKLIAEGTRNTFTLPSDIKPGSYILRTELLALHGNAWGKPGDVEPYGGRGPQFYTHCYNVDISGTGNVVPKGVKFPSPQGYKQSDYGVSFRISNQADYPWPSYTIPGPPKYQGKYDAPVGPQPVVTPKDTGAFPPEFQVKYEAFKQKWDASARGTNDFVNSVSPGMKPGDAPRTMVVPKYSGNTGTNDYNLTKAIEGVFAGFRAGEKTGDFFTKHAEEAKDMPKEIEALVKEGIKLGVLQP